MKILSINGSRRKHGNTSILLKTIINPALQSGASVDTVFLGDYHIDACTGCEGCSKSWECVIKDDFAQLIKKLDESDAILLGSPTYWYTVTSDMKRFIDRCYSLIQFPHSRQQWVSKYRNTKKVCITAAVCEQHDESMMGDTLNLLTNFSRDIGLELIDSVGVLRCFEARSIQRESVKLQQAEEIGIKLLQYLKTV